MTVAYIWGQARRLYLVAVILHVSFLSFGQIKIAEELKQCICGEEAPGKIVLIANGTAGPFSFQWTGPNGYESFRQEPTGLLTPGLYTVTITNAYACETILEVELEACPGINQLLLTPTGPSCNDPNNGSINLEVLGGVAPLSYEWSTGVTTQNISGLAVGTYNVTVTDNNGCTLSEEVILESVEPIVIAGLDDCAIAGEGIVELQVTGGVLPYTYLWNTGETSDLLAASAGDYTVTVTDAGGCTEVASFSIYGEPIVLADITPTTCELASGSIILSTAAGQTVINDWQWGDGATSPNRTGLAEGTYSVTATDANNCQFSASYVIESVNSLALNGTVTDATNCDEPGNGSISLSASGGNPPYLFEWADGPTGDVRTALSAGHYEVALSDQDGCTLIQTYTVASTASDLNLSATITDDCENRGEGAIITTVTGGQAPYTYQWGLFSTATTADLLDITAGRYLLAVTDAVGCTQSAIYTVTNHNLPDIEATLSPTSCGQAQGSISLVITNQPNPDPTAFQWADGAMGPNRNNLTAGIYQLTYTDPNGCQLNESYEVLAENIAFTLAIATTNSCPTASTGTIDVVASNGVAPYTFHWSDGAETTSLRSNLAAGNYDLTVTDANGCTAVESINVGAFPALNLVADIEPISCGDHTDGSIAITVSGGATPYAYLWSTGATTTSITGLAADDYTLTVTDALGCTAVETFSTISTEPQVQYPYIESVKVYAVSTTSSIDQVLIYDAQWLPSAWGCVFYTGGMLDISADLWQEMQDGLRELKVVARANKDMESMNIEFPGIPGSLSRLQSSGPLGSFTIGSSFVLNLINSNELDQRFILSGSDFASPPNELLDLRSYSNEMLECVETPKLGADCNWFPIVNENWNPYDDVHRLYKGCMDVDITISPSFDGIRYWANVDGGTYPYTKYVFTDPKGITQNYSGPNSPTLIAELPGRYCVEVHDAIGCISEACVDVCPTEEDIRNMILDGAQIVPPCPGASNGRICLPQIPEWPYKVNWLNGLGTERCLENIPSGSYPVDIIEFRCGNIVRVYLNLGSQNDPITISLASATAACPADNDGRLRIQASGGGGGYAYLWENGSTSAVAEDLSAGQCHDVTVSDACGNSEVACFEVPTYQSIAWGTPTVTRSCGTNNGAIAIQITGGKGPFTFAWEKIGSGENGTINTNTGIANVTDLNAGDYQISVTDACGENKTYPSLIEIEPSADNIAINYQGATISAACENEPSGGIDITMNTSPTTTYFYEWSTGATTQDVANIPEGGYSVTISGLGCEKVYYYTVPTISINISETIEAVCGGGNDGSISLAILGDFVEPLSFLWSNGTDDATLSGVAPGNYCVTVTDMTGFCEEIACFEVLNLSNDLEITVESITGATIGSPGQGDGAIDVSIIGGAEPYVFSWSNGATTEDIQNLEGGSFVLVVTDANGCSRTLQIDVPYCNPVVPEITTYPPLGITPISGSELGAINTSIHNGTSPFTYFWSGPGNFYDNKQDINNLSVPGEYCLKITDFCGTEVTECFDLVNDCDLRTLSLNPRNNCLNPDEGPSRLEFGGILLGSSASFENDFSHLHLQWSNGETGLVRVERSNGWWFSLAETISGVSEIPIEQDEPGYYSVIVTMENGCQIKGGAYFSAEEFDMPTARIEHISSDDLLPDTELDLFVVNELGICETCGFVDQGTFINNQCRNYFDKRFKFESVPDPACTTGDNICQTGGSLTFENYPGAGPYLVPCNNTAIYISEGDRCGCLFPPGTITGLPPSFVEGVWKEIEEYVYAPLCDPDGNTDIDIVIPPDGSGGGENYDLCYCEVAVSGQKPNIDVYKYDAETCYVYAKDEIKNTDPLIESYKQAIGLCIYAPDLCDFCPIIPLVSSNGNIFETDKISIDSALRKNIIENNFFGREKNFSKVFPNPFADQLTLIINDSKSTFSQVKMLNPLGKVLLNYQLAHTGIETTVNLQLPPNLPEGMYYIIIESERGKRAVHKVIHTE